MAIADNTTDLRALLAKANALPDADGGGNDFETKFLSDTLFEYENNQITSLREYCFYGVGNLRSVSMPELLELGSYAFVGSSLVSVNLPKVHTLGRNVFQQCSELTSISLPSAKNFGNTVFINCTNLLSANLPELQVAGAGIFRMCSSLEAIHLPKLQSIESEFAYQCTKLARAEFGKDVSSVAAGAFMSCTGLTTFILRSSSLCSLANKNAFTGSAIASGTGYIYIPSALVDSYKAASNWSTYAAQIRAIEDYPDITGG